MNELAGLHIVVTRPSAQAKPWAAQLQEKGAEVTSISLLDIMPVTDAADIQAIKNCILNLDTFHKAIFVSQNAVEQGFDWIENYWPQLPMGIAFFAVGETTARQLQARGVTVTDLAQTQAGSMTSETLLTSPALQQVAGEKIVIFRGIGGRQHLGETLTARGAHVTYCALYARWLPATAAAQFAHFFETAENLLSQHPLVVTLHSGESLDNFCRLLRENSLLVWMKKIVLLVPSQRIFEQAQAAGFDRIYSAQNATDPSMLHALIELKHNLLEGVTR